MCAYNVYEHVCTQTHKQTRLKPWISDMNIDNQQGCLKGGNMQTFTGNNKPKTVLKSASDCLWQD